MGKEKWIISLIGAHKTCAMFSGLGFELKVLPVYQKRHEDYGSILQGF